MSADQADKSVVAGKPEALDADDHDGQDCHCIEECGCCKDRCGCINPAVLWMESNRKLMILIKFIVPLVSLIISANTYRTIQTAYNSYSIIAKSWKKVPIYDVQPLTSAGSCSSGYTPITVPTFTGSAPGCYCPLTGTVTAGTCTASQLTTSCVQYAAVAPKPLPMWDSMKLCAAFYTDEFLKSQYRPHTNKNAPVCSSALSEDATLEVTSATWVACNGSISALGSASISLSLSSTQEGTCVKTGMTCPVTSVALSNTTIAGAQCTAFPSATTFAYVCVTRDTTKPAITDLQVYATGKCELGKASFDLYAPNDLRAAPRADQEGFATCSSFSPYATSVSTRQAYKVYADNGISSAPAFASDPHVYNLQTTSEAFWGLGCPVTRSGVNKDWVLTNLFVQVTLAVLVINAFACLTITGVLGYLEYRNLDKKSSPRFRNILRIKSGANFLIDLAKLSSTSISLACIVPLLSDFTLISATTLGVCTNSVSIQTSIAYFASSFQTGVYSTSVVLGIGIIEKIISIVQFVKLRKTLRVASEVDGAENARVWWEKDEDEAPYWCGERSPADVDAAAVSEASPATELA